ncbi:UNVERIFIED_CONTAM: hypothetical protein Scaly_3137800 [Sesamum calycinum]|uniref:Reverse transcriptase zinc-binding domain-containing protein n=1 Tax=Sesamum calycinum TaxID=2727403 RepID=A0AAW2JG77_9LAMI
MRKFLWQGPNRRGNAKVAWDQICKPKRRRPGIRSMTVSNKALMLKQLWRILHNDGTSIWVEWIQLGRLHNNTLWTFNGATGTWGWKKMLKLRPILQQGVLYKIGNGSTFKLWQDIWHERGPLCQFYPLGPAVLDLPLNSPLSCVIQQHQWCWPATTDAVIADIISHLPAIYPAETDSICWRTPSGRFTLESATLLIQPATPRVQWHGLLRGKYKIARHSFILWMAILEKLSTMDKPWIPRDDDGCVLCNGQFDETHSHLFFNCWFSRRCLTILHNKIKFQWPYLEWRQGIIWASKRWEASINLMKLRARFWQPWYIICGQKETAENLHQHQHQLNPLHLEF